MSQKAGRAYSNGGYSSSSSSDNDEEFPSKQQLRKPAAHKRNEISKGGIAAKSTAPKKQRVGMFSGLSSGFAAAANSTLRMLGASNGSVRVDPHPALLPQDPPMLPVIDHLQQPPSRANGPVLQQQQHVEQQQQQPILQRVDLTNDDSDLELPPPSFANRRVSTAVEIAPRTYEVDKRWKELADASPKKRPPLGDVFDTNEVNRYTGEPLINDVKRAVLVAKEIRDLPLKGIINKCGAAYNKSGACFVRQAADFRLVKSSCHFDLLLCSDILCQKLGRHIHVFARNRGW